MFADAATRDNVTELVDAIRERPTELPLSEILGVAERPVRVRIDVRGSAPIAFLGPRRNPLFDVLTDREREVAALVASGLGNRQIAETLFISVGTVKDHVHAILSKTDSPSRSAVAARWHEPV